MRARSQADLDKLRKQIGDVRRVSDRLIGIGPFGIGLDGLSSWIPIGGGVYSAAAAALLLSHAWRVHASKETISKMAALLAIDTATDVVPIPVIAPLVDMAFTGHKWASNILLKEMDRTIYVEGAADDLHTRPDLAELSRNVTAGREKRRLVFLHDRAGGAPADAGGMRWVGRGSTTR